MTDIPVLNYLTVELLTLIYPMVLLYKNIYPIIMIIIIIVHFKRFIKHSKLINKTIKPNLIILVLYFVLLFGISIKNNFILFGIMFGILQYTTYILHEKQALTKYKWIDYKIDIPITLMSSYISYIGYKNNNMLLTPFLGDLIYHLIEWYNYLK